MWEFEAYIFLQWLCSAPYLHTREEHLHSVLHPWSVELSAVCNPKCWSWNTKSSTTSVLPLLKALYEIHALKSLWQSLSRLTDVVPNRLEKKKKEKKSLKYGAPDFHSQWVLKNKMKLSRVVIGFRKSGFLGIQKASQEIGIQKLLQKIWFLLDC